MNDWLLAGLLAIALVGCSPDREPAALSGQVEEPRPQVVGSGPDLAGLVEPTTTTTHHHPTTTTRAPVRARATTPPVQPPPISGDVWHRLAMCETGGKMDNPNTGNGYFGYFQFDLTTWQSVGGTGYPHEHSYEVQKEHAQRLQAARGWSPWPKCSQVLGLR